MSTKDATRIQAVSWEYWDSVTLGAAALDATLFKTPTTTDGVYSSNFPSNGVLDAGEQFTIDGICWTGENDLLLDNYSSLSKGYLTLRVADRDHFQALLKRIPGGGGISGISNQGLTTGGDDKPSNGVPHVGNVYKISPTLTIDSGTQLKVTCNWPVAPGALKFWVILVGVRTRLGA